MLIAGIDIGGTQLRAGIYDEDHRLVDSFKAVNDRSMKAPDNMAVLTDYLERYRGCLGGIGIGCPGPLDLRGGRLLNPPNLVGWDGFEIVRFVGERTGLRPVLNNDGIHRHLHRHRRRIHPEWPYFQRCARQRGRILEYDRQRRPALS